MRQVNIQTLRKNLKQELSNLPFVIIKNGHIIAKVDLNGMSNSVQNSPAKSVQIIKKYAQKSPATKKSVQNANKSFTPYSKNIQLNKKNK